MTAAKIAEARGWPERLMIRDTGLHDDLGGPGQRIYTTAGRGYERVAYIRADLADAQAQEIARLRAENERLRNMAQLALFSQVFAGSHRHLKSGGLYDHIGTGRIQSEVPLADMDDVEIYIGARGDLWARRQVEFHDGRFAELNITPATGETS